MRLPTRIDATFKGYPNGGPGHDLSELGDLGWSILAEDVPLPVCLLKSSAIEHNSLWMQRFVEIAGASIAPHGKTTMSPQLFQRQLDDGAWGMTAATVDQLKIYREAGIGRVLMANQLVGRQAIDYVLTELARDPSFDFYCLVDSVAGVETLADRLRIKDIGRPLQVLLEGGYRGGRTGCRDVEAAHEVVAAIQAASPFIGLRGIEGYEGVIAGKSEAETHEKIGSFLGFLVYLLDEGVREGWFAPGEILLTAGGSAYYDLVSGKFGGAGQGREVRVVLRGGCYLSHDSKQYEALDRRLRERSAIAQQAGPGLRPALEVWSLVQSMPEPGLALLTMGKRDVSYDLHMPVPRFWARTGGAASEIPPGHEITGLNDQHAYLKVPADTPLEIGDMVGCGVSHPCTTFDKWQLMYLVDDAYRVTGGIRTFF